MIYKAFLVRKTKVICTIGPVTQSFDMLKELVKSGMNVARLNMSHGDHESHAKIIKAIKTLNKEINYPVPVLLDTQGPEIRTGMLKEDLELVPGDVISISVRADEVEETSFQINYQDLIEEMEIGDRITVDNGLINLEVLEKEDDRIMRCKVIDGGTLSSKRHVNLPGIKVNLPSITAKDKEDILFGIEQEVDFIALSFVRCADDIKELKTLLGDKANKIKIIAKIEDQEALRNIVEIVEEADAIMVARGDLGVEINIEDLPNVQRDIIQLCHKYGKRVIVATHLLESMIENPIPTRAEVTDIANAVFEGADAVMLSGETTVGKYPTKCVEYLHKIAKATEKKIVLDFRKNLISDTEKQSLSVAAVTLAEQIKARGIIVITRRGRTANFVTNAHPETANIYAFTNDNRTRRQLQLNKAVVPQRLAFSIDPEKTLMAAMMQLKENEGFKEGEPVVVVSDIIAGAGIDAIQIRYIPSS
ncbi:MAG: pyruvate kinase [Pseudomonadota bacterium]